MNLVEVTNLEKKYPNQTQAVRDVTFSIPKSHTIGLVGESGCGKTTLGRMILKLLEPTKGEIRFQGKPLSAIGKSELLSFRRQAQMIFQDPYASLNPRKNVFEILSEGPHIHRLVKRREQKQNVASLLELVGLNADMMDRYPHEFSGGQRQRIGIARALSVRPTFIVADEPVSALDVSVQAQIVNLLLDLQEKMQLTYLLISHDLRMIEYVSNRVIVMYLGKIMETLPAKNLSTNAMHPYTKALLSAVPIAKPNLKRNRILLTGEIPSPSHPPSGCVFHTRCPVAEARCKTETPSLRGSFAEHQIACHVV